MPVTVVRSRAAAPATSLEIVHCLPRCKHQTTDPVFHKQTPTLGLQKSKGIVVCQSSRADNIRQNVFPRRTRARSQGLPRTSPSLPSSERGAAPPSHSLTCLQLDIVAGQLHGDPDNADLKNLTSELTDLITLLDENIAELQPKQQPSKPASQEQPSSDDKWSRQNTSSYNKKNADDAEEEREGPVKYNVNDNVMARWLSGDKAFYPARITSTTGSSTDPIYIVKFKTYDNTETLRSHDIRPMSNKRKAEGAPAAAVASAPAPSENPAPGVVKSAGATHYAEAKRENDAAADAPKLPKPKKIKANKELEKSKNNWQEFNSKSKFGKKSKKDSMFRTPEGVNGRGTRCCRNLFPPKAVMLTYLQLDSRDLARLCERIRPAPAMFIK